MIYIYEMHAGCRGTDQIEWFTEEQENTYELAQQHAESYWNEQEGEPECWLEGTATTIAELKQFSGTILTGCDTLEDLVKEVEQATGRTWK